MQRRLLVRGAIVFLGLAAGIGLFAYLVARQGWESIVAEVVRFGLLPMLGFLAISLTIFAFYSLRWQIITNIHLPAGKRLPFWRMYLHRMSGYAVGYLTPAAQVAGEPARVALLMIDKVPAKEAVSSATLDIAFELCAYVFFMIAGVVFALIEGAGGGIAFGAATAGLIVLFVVLMVFFLAMASGKRVFSRVLATLRVHERATGKWLIDVEGLMTDFFKGRGRLIVGLAFFSLVIIAMRTVETYYLASMFDVNLTFGQVFLMSTLPGIALLLPIPGGLGVFEGSFSAVFSMMGVPLDPLAFAMIIRLRDLLFIGIGVVHMTRQGGVYFADRMTEASHALKHP